MKTLIIEPTRRANSSTRCAVMDWVVRRLAPRVAFGYPVRIEPGRLAQALARVLTDYSVFAGRLSQRDGSLWIDPGSGGVSLEIVESSESQHALVAAANASHGEQVTPNLAIGRALRGKAPLFAARLTHTPDGSVLGITWHHPVGDFHSAMLLLRAWARAYEELPFEPALQVPDRDGYLSEHVEDSPGATSFLRIASLGDCARLAAAAMQRTRRIEMEFQREELLGIQAAVAREKTVSVDDALWARVATAICQLRSSDAPTQLLHAVNLRWQLRLPLTLLGNMMSYATETFTKADSAAELASRLRTRLQQFSSRDVNHHATMRFAAAHPGRFQRELYMPVDLDPYRGNLAVSSVVHYPYNDLMFERTAPLLLFGIPNDRPLFHGTAIQPPGHAARATGRTVSLWLPEKLARRLESEEGRSLLLAGVAAERAPRLANSPIQHVSG